MRDAKWRKVADQVAKHVREGWSTTHEFWQKQLSTAGEPAYYTVVRALDNRQKPPKFETMALIAHYAGCTPSEIRQMASDVGAAPWDKIIGGAGESLGNMEKAVLSAVRKISLQNGKHIARIATNLEIMAEAAGVDISEELKALSR